MATVTHDGDKMPSTAKHVVHLEEEIDRLWKWFDAHLWFREAFYRPFLAHLEANIFAQKISRKHTPLIIPRRAANGQCEKLTVVKFRKLAMCSAISLISFDRVMCFSVFFSSIPRLSDKDTNTAYWKANQPWSPWRKHYHCIETNRNRFSRVEC